MGWLEYNASLPPFAPPPPMAYRNGEADQSLIFVGMTSSSPPSLMRHATINPSAAPPPTTAYSYMTPLTMPLY